MSKGWSRSTAQCPVCSSFGRTITSYRVPRGIKKLHRCRACNESYWSFEGEGELRVFAHHFEVEGYLTMKPPQ